MLSSCKRKILVDFSKYYVWSEVASGKVQPIVLLFKHENLIDFIFQELNADNFSAVIFPGGFGAAKNLSTFGVSSDPDVDDEVVRILRQFRDQKKPIGMCCIAPIIAAMVFAGKDGVPVTKIEQL